MSGVARLVLEHAFALTGASRGRVLDTETTGEPVALVIRLTAPDGRPVGVLELDDPTEAVDDGELRRFSELAAALLAEHRAGARLHAAHQDLKQRQHSLQTLITVERRLGSLVGGAGGTRAIVELCAELTGKVCVLYGADGRVVSAAGQHPGSPVRLPSYDDLTAATGALGDEPVELAPRPLSGLPRRHLLAAVRSGDEVLGGLVALEHPVRFRPLDAPVLRRAAEHIARELGIQRRTAAVAWNARSSLARQLIRGSNDVDDLRASGDYLGVDTGARRVLVYAFGSLLDAGVTAEQHLAAWLQRQLDVEVLATRGSEGVLFLVQVPDGVSSVEFVSRVKTALRRRGGAEIGAGELTAGLSSVCDALGLARGYRESREVAHCIDRFAPASSTRVLAVDDLGPARLFVANSAVGAVRAYIDDVLGGLLTGDPGAADLISTLGSYFDLGRSVRLSAAHLGVHENTVRLRLARVHAATGLDVAADANDQLSAQTALLVLRLQGHAALPSFESAADAQSRRSA